ncbi:DUF4062 domain-containing protein [Pareuzebyella sediminis]|uniref:DUF4062 domain-containing protein n=1 Tax=Pareuzebyella sediminis TaxID=2607998 RepID=UPI0011EF9864|nr:DUF4062 domain-containing protein [Pareuzebyella sediminis]
MKTIRIFIASSSELKEDRDQFRMFISQENDRLHTKGFYLELVQWENFLDAISDTRLQDEYNNAIRGCDIVLCLFFTKVGKYSAEEFDTAYQVFKDQGKPKIWTYFKNAEITTGSITDEINTLLAFKKKIGELGHFYTEYTNIDNLINKYRTQLDKYFQQLEKSDIEVDQKKQNDNPQKPIDVPVENTFNEILTDKLILAIKPYNQKANDFLTNNMDWQDNPSLVQTAKRLIISGYVGVLGIQLRKVISIGEEDFSQSKMKRYLENCNLTAKRALQLISFGLISTLWDYRSENKVSVAQTQTAPLMKFFKNAAEESNQDYANLIGNLIDIYNANTLSFKMPEVAHLDTHMTNGGDFYNAIIHLDSIMESIHNASFDIETCHQAERDLTCVLEHLSFLSAYKMISIKDIDYNQQRNDSEGQYLHNYTYLAGDNIFNANTQGNIRQETTPVVSYAVLLFKDNYRQNINMDPFIIDYNGLALTGGSKICFYSYCNTYGNLDLNYSFIEDNTKVVLKKSENIKPNESDTQAMNRWLADPENRKDMNFDKVYDLFQEAKKVLTGIEQSPVEDIF